MKLLTTAIITMALVARITSAQDTDAEIQARIDKLAANVEARTPEERAKDAEVRTRYKDAMVIDVLLPGTPEGYVDGTLQDWMEVSKLSQNTGFTFVSYTAAIDDTFTPLTIIDWIAKARRYWTEHSDTYHIVETVDDIYEAKKTGKFGVNMNFQGSNPLGGNINMVEIYYKLGVRSMNFAYNVRNHMADGGGVDPDRDGGLSKAGKRLVAEMNRVGMIVDCTHSSNRSCLDAAEISTQPIMLSHSNAYGHYALPRNSPDEVIKAVAKTDGIICTNGLGGFLNKEGNAGPGYLAANINYVKELVGAKHTCFGSDYVYKPHYIAALAFVLRNPESYPPELGYGSPTQMAEPGDVWGVAAVLESQYGWSEKEIRGFLGENALRVYKANWK